MASHIWDVQYPPPVLNMYLYCIVTMLCYCNYVNYTVRLCVQQKYVIFMDKVLPGPSPQHPTHTIFEPHLVNAHGCWTDRQTMDFTDHRDIPGFPLKILTPNTPHLIFLKLNCKFKGFYFYVLYQIEAFKDYFS